MTEPQSPMVSVLLPTHNRSDVLPFAIQSALGQTWPNFELIVVGDGCTDGTAAVVAGFDDPRLTWHDLPKAPGFGYANRNLALRQSQGEIVAYLAHDDIWFPDHLAQLVNCLISDNAELAYSMSLNVSPAGYIEPRVFNLHDPVTWDDWRLRLLGHMPTTSVLHRRSCLEHYGYWNEELAQGADWDLWMRIMHREPDFNFTCLPAPTSLHFVASYRRYNETRLRNGWRRLRAWEGSAQPELKIDVSEGQTEQAAAWQAMSQDPAGWTRALRRAVQVDLDRRGAFRFTLSDLFEAGHQRLVKRTWVKPTKFPKA